MKGLAAVRHFDQADDRSGSIAPDQHDRDARPMSASSPIAVKHWHHSETPLRANSVLMRRINCAAFEGTADIAC